MTGIDIVAAGESKAVMPIMDEIKLTLLPSLNEKFFKMYKGIKTVFKCISLMLTVHLLVNYIWLYVLFISIFHLVLSVRACKTVEKPYVPNFCFKLGEVYLFDLKTYFYVDISLALE